MTTAPTTAAADKPSERATTRRVAFAMVKQEPVAYAIATLLWVCFQLLPIPSALLLRAVLNRIESDPSGSPVWLVLAVFAGFEVGRWVVLLSAAVQWRGVWAFWHTVPRLNLLTSLVSDPGPASSSGDAVSRFRDDTQNLAKVLDVWLDVAGAVAGAIGAIVLMLSVDARITLVVVLPVVVVLVSGQLLSGYLKHWRRIEREATAAVTGFIGDTFGSVMAVKAGGAEPAVLRRFAALGANRAAAARRDQVATQLMQTLSGAAGSLGTGVMLVIIAPAIASGRLSVGDLGLFVSSITVLAVLPRWMAFLSTYQRQADVSVERMAELLPTPEPMRISARHPTALRHGPPPYLSTVDTDPHQRVPDDRLQQLAVEGLTVAYGGGVGIDGIDLALRRGTLTVVTGPVGSGKSTLVRALLGLIPVDGGHVKWNGVRITQPSTFFVPPRAAYMPQSPRLFSETLAETILLGVGLAGLDRAIHLACLDDDVEEFEDAMATMVGPKGVRLSGGQVQRAAAARALVRRPELLILDDLSSALDITTERRLWDRLLNAEDRSTMLVISHRAFLIQQADQVLELK